MLTCDGGDSLVEVAKDGKDLASHGNGVSDFSDVALGASDEEVSTH